MALMEGMTAIVLGSIFAGIFVITCFISSIKAVRDRRRMMRKISAKAKQRVETEQGKTKEAKPSVQTPPSNGILNTISSSVEVVNDTQNFVTDHVAEGDGVCNASFTPSNADIKSASEGSNENPSIKIGSNKSSSFKSRTLSGDLYRVGRDRDVNMPPECLTDRKTARRHSYELAVAENSWMPVDPPSFTSSEKIFNAYRHVGNNIPRSMSVGFENKAYDRDDVKTFRLKQRL